jgi:hypothetical protein
MNTPDFSGLQEFIDQFGFAEPHDRLYKRTTTSLTELKRFHDAVDPRLEEIIELLNQYPINDIPEQHMPLAYMALAMCEVDDAVKIWGSANLKYISDPNAWQVKTHFYGSGDEHE